MSAPLQGGPEKNTDITMCSFVVQQSSVNNLVGVK